MIAWIDGDVIAYRASVASPISVDFGDGEEVLGISLEMAEGRASQMVREWTKGARCTKSHIVFTHRDRQNFRKLVYENYKSQRTGEYPEHYWPVIEYLTKYFECSSEPWLEGDDLMGIYCGQYGGVMVTIDKDLKTVPGGLYNPTKPLGPRRTTRSAADYNWMMQTLCGDPVDGYPGCPKIGEKKATALLDATNRTVDQMWPAVVEKFGNEHAALQQARCARILRYGEYDFARKVVHLWSPSGPVPMNPKELYEEMQSAVPQQRDDSLEVPEADADRTDGGRRQRKGHRR